MLEYIAGIVAGLTAAVVAILLTKAVVSRRVRRTLANHPMADTALLDAVRAERANVSVTSICTSFAAVAVAMSGAEQLVSTPLLMAFEAVLIGVLAVLGGRTARLSELSRAAQARGLELPGGRWAGFLAKGRA